MVVGTLAIAMMFGAIPGQVEASFIHSNADMALEKDESILEKEESMVCYDGDIYMSFDEGKVAFENLIRFSRQFGGNSVLARVTVRTPVRRTRAVLANDENVIGWLAAGSHVTLATNPSNLLWVPTLSPLSGYILNNNNFQVIFGPTSGTLD